MKKITMFNESYEAGTSGAPPPGSVAELLACRACLATDIRLYTLSGVLKQTYEYLLGMPLTTNIVRNIDRESHKLLKFTLDVDSKVIHMIHKDDRDINVNDHENTNDKDGTDGLLVDFEDITKTLNDDVDLDLSDNELDIDNGSPFIDRAKSFNVEELFKGKINNDLNYVSKKNINNDITYNYNKAFKGKNKAFVKKSTDNINSLIAVNNEDTSSTFRDAEEVLKANINDLPDVTLNDISMNANDLNDTDSNLVDTFNNFILDHGYVDEKLLLETGDTEITRKHVMSKNIDEDSLLREIIPNMSKKREDKKVFLKDNKTKNNKMKLVKNLSKLKEVNKAAKLKMRRDIVKRLKSNRINDKAFNTEDESKSSDNESIPKPIFTKPELPLDGIKSELSQEFIKFGSDYNFRIFELSKEEQLEELQQKREGELYVSAPYKCVDCAKAFKTADTYGNHVKVHEPSHGPFSCDICHSRHASEARRRRHADTHRLKYCCTRCEVVARSRERAEAHFQWHAGKTYSCQYCGEQFGKVSTHLSHIRLHHPDACVWCAVCGEAFVGALGLQQHTRRRHPTVNTMTKRQEAEESYCFTCRIQFQSQEAFQRHKAVPNDGCHSQLRFCSICGDSFESELVLLQHRRSHADAPLQCHVCSAEFSSVQSRETHVARAHVRARARVLLRLPPPPPAPPPAPRPAPRAPPTRKPAMCELCGKNYHSAAALSYHQRSHSGEKPYTCTRCHKSFALNHSLQAHMRTHTGERPYRCARCPRAFLNANNLTRHNKTVHLGQKQYSCCTVCRRWLSSPGAAARHAAMHGHERDKQL